MFVVRGPALSPQGRGVGSHKGLEISTLPGMGSHPSLKTIPNVPLHHNSGVIDKKTVPMSGLLWLID